MTELEHRKHLVVQRIQSHRELFKLECVRLREQNPLTPVVALGRQALGIVRNAVSGSAASGARLGAGLRLEQAALLPVALGLLHRLRKRRKQQPSSSESSPVVRSRAES